MNSNFKSIFRLLILVPLALGFLRCSDPLLHGDVSAKNREPTISNGESEQELVQRINRIREQSLYAMSTNEAISVLEDGLAELGTSLLSRPEPEIRHEIARVFYELTNAYTTVTKYDKALAANAQELAYLKKLYDEDPSWNSKRISQSVNKIDSHDALPVSIDLFDNRLRYSLLVLAKTDASPDAKTRQEVRDAIKYGTEALQRANVPNEKGGFMWSNVCLAHWANGDLVEAQAALDNALTTAGRRSPAKTETKLRQQFFGRCYLIQACLLAEQENGQKAIDFIDKATDYLREDPDPKGLLGHAYLLVARASSSLTQTEMAIDQAIKHLELSDGCESCRYELACAYGKKSMLEDEPARATFLGKATDSLLYVLDRLRTFAIEPKLDAIARDPFLMTVVDQKVARDAIRAYKWDPNEDNARFGEFWHFGIPLKMISYTRLNGDDRLSDVHSTEHASSDSNSPLETQPDATNQTTKQSPQSVNAKRVVSLPLLGIMISFGFCFLLIIPLAIRSYRRFCEATKKCGEFRDAYDEVLHKVGECAHPEFNIVFIHGISGNHHTTWQAGDAAYWPRWVAEDFPNAQVYALQYNAAPLRWMGPTMPLISRGKNLLNLFDSVGIFHVPCVFIAHSFGGLVLKQLWRTAHDRQHREALSSIRGIIFLATPHQGSLLTYLDTLAKLVGQATVTVADLKHHNQLLLDLDDFYRNHPVPMNCAYYETQPTQFGPISLHVVDEASGTLTLPGVMSCGLCADHQSICKPASHDHDIAIRIHNDLKNFADTLFEPPGPF